MLTVIVPESELFDSAKNEFIYVKEQTLKLEHSLLSVSKWEAKWKKPFLGKESKTWDETIDYIRCMTINSNVDPVVYKNMPRKVIERINNYIDDPMTATTFREDNKRGGGEIITSEIIYYWMVNFNIPFECEKWHLNRLLTLVKVCSIKSDASQKKMKKNEILAQNNKINEMRRRQLGSKG